MGSPGVPSSISGIRTPSLPLLPVWEKGAGGMKGRTRTGIPAHPAQTSGARASGAHAGGTPAHPAQTSGARASGAHTGGTPAHPAQTSGARASGAHAGGTSTAIQWRADGARLRRARGRDACAPGANLRCARPRRGRFVDKLQRAISCFGHQDAQSPLSPRVGGGGRGDEGAKVRRR